MKLESKHVFRASRVPSSLLFHTGFPNLLAIVPFPKPAATAHTQGCLQLLGQFSVAGYSHGFKSLWFQPSWNPQPFWEAAGSFRLWPPHWDSPAWPSDPSTDWSADRRRQAQTYPEISKAKPKQPPPRARPLALYRLLVKNVDSTYQPNVMHKWCLGPTWREIKKAWRRFLDYRGNLNME